MGAEHRRTTPVLRERWRDVLAFEERRPRHDGAKEQAIRETFGLTSARYYQLLGAVLDTPEALAHDPLLVKRLIRLRDARVAERRARMQDAVRGVLPE